MSNKLTPIELTDLSTSLLYNDSEFSNKQLSEQEVVDLISNLSRFYYEGSEIISDDQFDKLCEKYSTIYPDLYIWKETGWGYNPEWSSDKESVNHEVFPMKSISSKTKSIHFMNDKEGTYIATPKLDGAGLTVTYDDGKLEKAVSRGGRLVGHNITDIISQLVPATIPTKERLIIRGELSNKADKNSRNQSSGMIMRKNYTLTDEEKDSFMFIPYGILNIPTSSKSAELTLLKSMGFIEVPNVVMEAEDFDLLMTNDDERNELLTNLSIINEDQVFIDGIVFEKDEPSTNREGNLYDRHHIAFKLDSEVVETSVIGIKYQHSNQGKFTPVVQFEKVDIEGAGVKRSAGGSYSYLVKKGLGIGARVGLIRSGGVIPYVKSVFEPSQDIPKPDKCPVCNHDIELVKADLYCTNPICDKKVNTLTKKIFNKFVPHGYGTNLYNRLVESYSVNTIEEYLMFINLELDKVGSITTNKQLIALKELQVYTKEWRKTFQGLLALSNIPGLGPKLSKKLEAHYQTVDNLLDALDSENTKEVDDFIKKLSNKTVVKSFRDYKQFIRSINNFFSNNPYEVKVEKVVSSEDSEKELVVLTNIKGQLKKSDIMKMKSEYKFTDSVTEKVKYLVYSIPNSSKHKKAIKLGVECISLEEFLRKS